MENNLVEVHLCNVCGSSDLVTIFEIFDYPVVLRPVSPEKIKMLENRHIPKYITLRFGMCQDCGHIVQLFHLCRNALDAIYEACYDTYVSNLIQGISSSFEDNFIDLFLKLINDQPISKERSILEVGCFDGYLLAKLQEHGFKVCGCDPSEGANIGKNFGIDVIRSFYSPKLFSDRRFDAVINRHVLEHIDNPSEFIAELVEVLTPDGAVFLETPNGNYYLNHGLLDPFHPEHLSVFTTTSLARVFANAGMRLKHIIHNAPNLVCVGRPHPMAFVQPELDLVKVIRLAEIFMVRLNNRINMIRNLLDSIRNSRVAVWGAGAFGAMVLSLFGKHLDEILLIDRDTNKHGSRFYHGGPEVSSVEVLNEQCVDYIVVASQFSNEIVDDVRLRYGFKQRCILLSPEIKILE